MAKEYCRVCSRVDTNLEGKILPVGTIYGRIGRVFFTLDGLSFVEQKKVILEVKLQGKPWVPMERKKAMPILRFIAKHMDGVRIPTKFQGIRVPPNIGQPYLRGVNYNYNYRQWKPLSPDNCDHSPVVYNPDCFRELYRNKPQPGGK